MTVNIIRIAHITGAARFVRHVRLVLMTCLRTL
jgi:hypothetical protein